MWKLKTCSELQPASTKRVVFNKLVYVCMLYMQYKNILKHSNAKLSACGVEPGYHFRILFLDEETSYFDERWGETWTVLVQIRWDMEKGQTLKMNLRNLLFWGLDFPAFLPGKSMFPRALEQMKGGTLKLQCSITHHQLFHLTWRAAHYYLIWINSAFRIH